MRFQKVSMNRGEIFQTIVKDNTGKVIDKWVVMKEDFIGVIKILNKKYGLGISVKKRDQDLEWVNDYDLYK